MMSSVTAMRRAQKYKRLLDNDYQEKQQQRETVLKYFLEQHDSGEDRKKPWSFCGLPSRDWRFEHMLLQTNVPVKTVLGFESHDAMWEAAILPRRMPGTYHERQSWQTLQNYTMEYARSKYGKRTTCYLLKSSLENFLLQNWTPRQAATDEFAHDYTHMLMQSSAVWLDLQVTLSSGQLPLILGGLPRILDRQRKRIPFALTVCLHRKSTEGVALIKEAAIEAYGDDVPLPEDPDDPDGEWRIWVTPYISNLLSTIPGWELPKSDTAKFPTFRSWRHDNRHQKKTIGMIMGVLLPK